MNARKRAITTSMHPINQSGSAFKRQVVFRLAAHQWPLLEHAAREHGSIQAAIVAGLQALATHRQQQADKPARTAAPAEAAEQGGSGEEEITAREAARLLNLKPSTVRGYIRTGRLPGHYDDTPRPSGGWITTRAAIDHYRKQVGR